MSWCALHAAPSCRTKPLTVRALQGRATSTSDGFAIAFAASEHLLSVGAFTLCATHMERLADLGALYAGTKHCHLRVINRHDGQLHFAHELTEVRLGCKTAMLFAAPQRFLTTCDHRAPIPLHRTTASCLRALQACLQHCWIVRTPSCPCWRASRRAQAGAPQRRACFLSRSGCSAWLSHPTEKLQCAQHCACCALRQLSYQQSAQLRDGGGYDLHPPTNEEPGMKMRAKFDPIHTRMKLPPASPHAIGGAVLLCGGAAAATVAVRRRRRSGLAASAVALAPPPSAVPAAERSRASVR